MLRGSPEQQRMVQEVELSRCQEQVLSLLALLVQKCAY
jgi:hypothetical protein